MSVILDTGVLVGAIDTKDPHHERAARLFAAANQGKHGRTLILDEVYVETMNYLARKPRRRSHAEAIRRLRSDRASTTVRIASQADEVARATELYFDEYERELSMTDCLIVVAARRLGAKVATLDSQFQGLVALAN